MKLELTSRRFVDTGVSVGNFTVHTPENSGFKVTHGPERSWSVGNREYALVYDAATNELSIQRPKPFLVAANTSKATPGILATYSGSLDGLCVEADPVNKQLLVSYDPTFF